MNPNWIGVIAATFAVVVFFLAYRFGKKMSAKTLWVLVPIFVLAAVPAASFSLYYLHLVEVPAWYYQFRSLRGIEFLLLFIGACGGLVSALLPRGFLPILLSGIVILSILPSIKPFIGPLDFELMQNRWDKEVCLQSTSSTCGAASTASVLSYLGEEIDEQEVAREAHSYSGGTEAWYLARVVRRRGYEARFEVREDFDPNGSLPAVVGVRLGMIGHFIAILGIEDGQYLVGDPMRGRETMTLEELQSRYDFTGFQMEVLP